MECIFTCPTCGMQIVWDNQYDKKQPNCPQCPPAEEQFESHSSSVVELWDQIEEDWKTGDLKRATQGLLDILLLQPEPTQMAWENLLMPERADMSGVPKDLLNELPEVFSGSSSAEEREKRRQFVKKIQQYVVQPNAEPTSGANSQHRSGEFSAPDIINVEAASLEEARKQARLQTPDGFQWISLQIESDGNQKTIKENGGTTETAFVKAQKQVPEGAKILSKQEIVSPWKKGITIEAEDESQAKSLAIDQSDSAATIVSTKLVTQGKKGFLGIGKKPNQYEVKMMKQATVEIAYKENVRLSIEAGPANHGTRQDTFDMAMAFWMSRMSSKRKDPFLMYFFDEEKSAKEALLELPCIQENEDGSLVCSDVLTFGYYASQEDGKPDGKYEAIICGDDLTFESWEHAKNIFSKHGGVLNKELNPEKHDSPSKASMIPQPDKVIFVEEEVSSNVTYRVHKGLDVASALAFLDENPIHKPSYHIVVETPGGTYCRDINGFYKE